MLENLVIKTRRYIETNFTKLDLPFVNKFPNSCCEIVSLLLGKIIIDEFPMKDVVFVKGTNTSRYEMHFWIEVGDLVFDITADQFENINSFVIGELPEVLIKRFDDLEKTEIIKALKINDLANNHSSVLEQISIEIRRQP